MGRIPDHLLRLAQRVAEGRWVTIGAKADPKRPGKKKGGTPVELDGEGVIQKGPAALTGKRPSELSQSHLFTGQPHMSQRKMFAEPGDPVPPPRLDPEAKPQAQAPAKKELKPKAKKPQNMSLLAVIRREGGISGGDFEHADFREHGLLGALNKNGFGIDDMAAMLVRGGHIIVPHGVSSPGDHLLQLLKKKTNSLLADKTSELEKDYEAYARAREEALAHGHESGDLEKVRGRGQEAGADAGTGDILEEIFGPDLGRGGEAGAEEPGDLAGDAAEPAGGVDTSFDFGPAAAPKVEDKPKAEPKKAAADKPKGATLQPDGTLKTKDGTVWVRAKAGGEHSPVTDKHYKGGQWMPIHGMSKPKAEKPAEEPVGTQAVEPGEGDKERAEDMAGPRPPRERMSPEEKAERQQAKDHWDAMNQGPMKDLVWLGDYPNQKALSGHIVGTNKWQQFAQKVGEEKLKAIAQHFKDKLKEIDPSFFEDGMDKVHQSRIDYNKTFFKRAHRKESPSSAEAHYWFQTALGETPKTAADWRSVNDQLAGLVADEPAPPPAVEPEPAAKQPHEMTAAEYLRSGRPNYGDLVQTPDGKVGTLQGGGGIGSTRVKVNGVWHDRNDLKLVKRPDKDTRQNLSDEWKAKQKADLEKIEKEHGEVLHKKSMVDSAKKRLQAGTMTQDQYDKFVGSGPYKMTDAEMARAEKAQAEIDAIKDRPLEFDQSVHAQAVANALAMGKDVPANVLAEYPDLAKKYGKDKAQSDGPAAPPAPGTNLFGQPEPTKPQPATTQGLFGEQVPVEDKKTQPQPTAADDAAKGLDWLDQKQDRKTDGTGEMFGGLFSPGQQASQGQQEPVAPPRTQAPDLSEQGKANFRRNVGRVRGATPAEKAASLGKRASAGVGSSDAELNGMLNLLRDEYPDIYKEIQKNPGLYGPNNHALVAAHTGGPGPEQFDFDAEQAKADKALKPGSALDRIGMPPKLDANGNVIQAKPVAPEKIEKGFRKFGPPQKPPHEMTRAEFAAQGPTEKAKQYLADSGMHRGKVQAALDAGQNVPAEVLADYPGIKKTEPQQGPTAKEITGKIQAETDARRAQAKQDDAKARVRDVEDYQQARQAAIDAGQDVNDGDEKQMRRMIRQNEKDRARALQTIANNGPDAEAQAYADRLGKENERLQAKLAKSAGPVAPPAVEPSPTAAAARTLSLPDRIKNLNALLNKTRSRANAKALRATIAQLERKAEGSTAPPKVEPEPAGPQPKKPFSDSEDYTVEKNPNYDQWIFKAKNGKEIGEIQLKKRLSDGNFVTANVLVWPEFQRKGYATKFYKNAADYAKSQGKKLYLSKDRSKDALKLHDFFAKKGILSEDGELFPEKPAKPEPPRQPSAPPKVETAAASTGPKSQSFDDFRRENGVQGYTIDHSMLSPSGRVSGRSANAARARVDKQFSDYNQAEKEYQAKVDAGEIVDPTGKYQKPDQAKANKAEAERMREKAKNFRSIAARGMQTRKLTKQAEELERQANELDPPARPETGPTTPPPVEPVPSQGQMGGAKRRNLVGFNPIKGPSGAKLTGYNWEYDLEHYVDQRGEDRERKVSAWDRAERAGMTNRDIVHMFNVEGPDGKQHTVSLETAAKMLGYDGGSEQFKAKFKSATSAAKTLAKLQMEKAQAEQSNAARQKALDELKQQVPAMTDDQVEEVPGFLGNKNGLRIKGVDGSTVVYSRDGMGRTRDEAKQFLKQSWIEKELKKRGHDPFGQKSLTDIDRRILRAKNKLDELTKQASTAPATESARIRALLREAA